MAENSTQDPSEMPEYKHYQRRRKKNSKWWIPLVIVGGVVVLVVVFAIAIFSVIASSVSFEQEEVVVKNNSVLYLDLAGVKEYHDQNPFASLFNKGSKASLLNVIHNLKAAKTDDKIKGLYYKPSMMGSGMTKRLEILDAMKDFKESGKFIYAFIEVGDENAYINALVADSIFMPEEGMMELNGYSLSNLFMKGFFNKVGLDFYVQQFEDFKSAGESYSRKKFSDSARKQLEVLLNNRYNTLLDLIAENRGLTKDFINDVMNRGVISPDSLLALGFIDGIAPEYAVRNRMKEKANGSQTDSETNDGLHNHGKVKLISMDKYNMSHPPTEGKLADPDNGIAIVFGTGAITSGTRQAGFGNTSQGIYASTFIKNLKKARDNDDVQAIILRINSPGGSVIASDEIWGEIKRTQELRPDVPIYASMSDVAASGGYYMAIACDTIIAHPETITGSIGVILSIPNVSGVLEKLDLTVDTISTTRSGQAMNTMLPFTSETKNMIYGISKKIYYRFLGKVAANRGMTVEEIRSVAKGRVWTGADAKTVGLVDVLGGLEDAIQLAKNRIGVATDEKVKIYTYPKEEDDVLAFMKLLGIHPNGEEDMEVQTIDLAKTFGLNPTTFLQSWDGLPEEMKQQMLYGLELMKISKHEHAMMAMPYNLQIK